MDQTRNKMSMHLDFRLVSAVLLAVILVMLLVWKPWGGGNVSDRTIEVTGQTTLRAVPDEFVFYPTYEFKNSDKQAALKELSDKSSQLTAELKKLGVADSKIKTNSDSWSYPVYFDENSSSTPTYTLRLTVTTGTQELAQKVQNYLITTSPTGTISPQANFSEAKRKQLEAKARDQATKEARTKADQSAKNLGFKVAGVKTVNDGTGFGIFPTNAEARATDLSTGSTSLAVQPGENELSYSVTVTYFIK